MKGELKEYSLTLAKYLKEVLLKYAKEDDISEMDLI